MCLVSSSPTQSEIRTATVGAADVQWPVPIPPKTSAGEVRCQLYVAKDQDYLSEAEFNELYDQAGKGARQLYRLIQHLDDGDNTSRVRELPSKYVA